MDLHLKIKFQKKHNFLYMDTPKSTVKYPNIIKIKHNRIDTSILEG